MDNKEFAQVLEKRIRMFARIILQLSAKLDSSKEELAISQELIPTAGAIGVHYRQAGLAKSEEDFIKSILAAEASASKVVFYLELIQDMGWFTAEGLNPIINEAKELLALFTSLYVNAKKKK